METSEVDEEMAPGTGSVENVPEFKTYYCRFTIQNSPLNIQN